MIVAPRAYGREAIKVRSSLRGAIRCARARRTNEASRILINGRHSDTWYDRHVRARGPLAVAAGTISGGYITSCVRLLARRPHTVDATSADLSRYWPIPRELAARETAGETEPGKGCSRKARGEGALESTIDVAGSMPLCSHQRAELAFDVLTAAVSFADIVTDVFVTREFHLEEHHGFFVCSLALLLVAQCSYAFMFAGTFAPSHSAIGQFCVFTLALPFGQLVPIFTWVESLRNAAVTGFVRRLGLKPSCDAETDSQSAADADELWSAIQSKYRSHAGFLLEAIVEAVPQGLLQTVFIVVYGKLTPLTALSLSFSLVVLCSKGWIFSYSLHRTTFVLNSLCIAADIVGLFATVCWLASPATASKWWPSQFPDASVPDEETPSLDSLVPTGCETWFDGCNTCVVQDESALLGCTKRMCQELSTPRCLRFASTMNFTEGVDISEGSGEGSSEAWTLGQIWVGFGSTGLVLSYTGGFALLLFAVFDDHLKLDIRQRLRGFVSPDDPPLVRLYLYRTVGWVLALLPCSVAWLTARLSWLPVLVFHSFDPEHATRPEFYRRLYYFLHTGALQSADHDPSSASPAGETDESSAAVTARLVAVNEWIAHARAAKPELLQRLATHRSNTFGGQRWRGSSRTEVLQESAVVAAWSRIVGAEHRGGTSNASNVANSAEEEELDLESLLLILNQPVADAADGAMDDVAEEGTPVENHIEDAAATRARVRRALLAASIQQRRAAADADLLARSEIVRGIRNHGESTMRTGSCCLRLAGTLSLGCGALLVAVWIPVTVCFWTFSALYPFLNMHRCGGAFGDSDLAAGTDLACALTAVQAFGILLMIGLLPSVRRWQGLRMDLIGLDGFPQCFYGDEVLVEMVQRARHSLEQQALAPSGDRRAVRRQQERQHIADNPALADGVEAFDLNCSICLEPLDLGDGTDAKLSVGGRATSDTKVVVALPMCMHAFHKECIYQWLGANRSCPNCRADVARRDDNHEADPETVEDV